MNSCGARCRTGSRSLAEDDAESSRQHRLTQRLRALQVRVDLGFDFADDREAAVDFGDDAVLRLIFGSGITMPPSF
jgi:hypothetical protein